VVFEDADSSTLSISMCLSLSALPRLVFLRRFISVPLCGRPDIGA
jgi:hypothetical protein